MIHDFATAPRTPRDLPIRQSAPVVPAQKLSRGLVLGVVLALVVATSIWRIVTSEQVSVVEGISPTVEARQEYLQAADSEEVLLSGPEPVVEVAEAVVADSTPQEFELRVHAKQGNSEEEDYGFYDTLQASAWSVPVQRGIYLTAEDRQRASYTYMLQAASLKSRSEAVSLVATLQKKGLAASYTVSGGGVGKMTWYRVNVGPFNNVSVMNKAKDVLVSMRMMPLKRRIQ